MIQLIPLIQAKTHEQTLKSLYHDSFPPDERRDWNELTGLTVHSPFNIHCIHNSNGTIGLLTLWKWLEFTFIEHFAINKTFQGKGIGSEVINQLKHEASTKIILETEEPTTDLAIRRINFYARLGFHRCNEEYYQPPYSKDKKAVKMVLMSYPGQITPSEFIAIRAKLYREVYRRNITEFP
ncbi:MAG TPA: GNAT family N-acetyltransferase [Prolixibacteraceae bacterium]|nr:GNAT family N-acetyltransferase [Prolixibacteraceae bacterium]